MWTWSDRRSRLPVSHLSRSVPLQLAAPWATPPSGAGTGRVKTWNPENLKTCRAPQPRGPAGSQDSRFPGFPLRRTPRRPRPPRRSAGSPLSPEVTRGPGPWGWPCRAPERPRGAPLRGHGEPAAGPPSAPQSRPAGRSRPRRRGSLASWQPAATPERQAASSPSATPRAQPCRPVDAAD